MQIEDAIISTHTDGGCCSISNACNPVSRLHRYLMLIFICFLSFGSYFCYDNPAALQDVFLKEAHLSVSQFMNLYAFYSWPNIILSLVGGFLIDRLFGVRWGAIIFSLVILFGQVIFAIGVFFSSVSLMYFARFIFGIGGESLAVAQNTYATVWYRPNELNFVFGLTLSMARIGSTVNMNSMQPLYKKIRDLFQLDGEKQLGICLLVASVSCIFSSLCACILAYFYKRYTKAISETPLEITEPCNSSDSFLPHSSAETTFPTESSPLIASTSTHSFTPNDFEQKITISDIFHFPSSIWLICVICVAYYVTVFPFVSLGLVFFERKYGLPPSSAAAVNSMVYIVSAIASPICGACIDFLGYNLVWVATGIFFTALSHAAFAFTISAISPLLLMIVMGISYSILASSLWPMVGTILPQHQRATAYGLIQSVQNLGLGLISLLAGYIVDTRGYLFLELFFLICLSIAFGATFLLYVWDLNNGVRLNVKRHVCTRNYC